jgi:hypothetical protein
MKRKQQQRTISSSCKVLYGPAMFKNTKLNELISDYYEVLESSGMYRCVVK